MLKRTNFLAAGLISMSLIHPAVAQDVSADTIVTTVNGVDITLGHMIVLREGLPEQYQSLPDDVLFNGILEQLVQQTVLAQKAPEPGSLINLRLENERRTLMAGTAVQGMVAEALTEEAVQAAYDERFAEVEPSKEYDASHILVETEDEAKSLVQDLSDGADFAELAKEKSTGPSGPNGGALGWFGPGMMVKPFEDAVIGMDVGGISEPVQTQFGWHVIKLNDSRLQDVPVLEDVRAELTDEIQSQVIETALSELIASADIQRPDLTTIDPALIRSVDLLDN